MPGVFSDKPLHVTELNTTALALAALLGLTLACLAYHKCAKPVLDEQDFKLKKARKEAQEARKARAKMS